MQMLTQNKLHKKETHMHTHALRHSNKRATEIFVRFFS